MNKNGYRPAGRERAGLAARNTAAHMLERVVDGGQNLDRLCDNDHGLTAYRALIAKDRALVRAIVTTALRRRGQIGCVLARCLDRALPKRASHLQSVLHVGVAQILFMDIPASAAVNLAVTGLREDRRSVRFAALGNAILRRIERERDSLTASCSDWRLALSPWLGKRLQTDFGREKAKAAAIVALEGAPLDLTLSPDLSPSDRAMLIEALNGVELANGSVRLFHQTPVRQLPAYDEGKWWVQDYAASLPVRMLGHVRGLRIADLCAAPGGKTAQLAACGARVMAVDRSTERLEILAKNMERLNLEVESVEADLEDFVPNDLFDAVVLDAPCSATGTLRRHPEVGWIKSDEQVSALAGLQKRLLEKAIAMTRDGGRVVYANCSLLREEGEDIAADFAARQNGVMLDPLKAGEIGGADGFINRQGTLRTLPGDNPPGHSGGMDGFFAARFIVT